MSTLFLRQCRRNAVSLAAVMLVAGVSAQSFAQTPAAGQGQSMEERLRNQLRITTSQLQDAQSELATLKAGHAPVAAGAPAAAAPDVEALKKELASSKAQLAEERRKRSKSESTEAALKQANDQATQYKNAYDQMLKLARTSEAERQRLSSDAGFKKDALAQCEAKNVKLYAQGQEILHAYETVDVKTVLSSREPFATKSRVAYDQIAQEFGDKLYEGKFDERSVNAPAAPAAAAAPAAPAAQ